MEGMPSRLIDVHNHPQTGSDGSDLIALMDAANIEMTVIMATMHCSNDTMLAACQRYPGRLIGGVYADPREGTNAIETVRRYHAQGVRIVKLFPNIGYFPDDPALHGFFDAVAGLGMMVLSHCGWLGGSGKGMNREDWAAYYATPGRFEKVLRRHPDTPFIFAHMGGITGLLESVMLTTRAPNAYVDCSPGQGLWALRAGGAITASVPPEKLLWGSDSYSQQDNLDQTIPALTALGFGPHFDKIFRSNALGLLQRIGTP
jgi:predicted TIM-barrel fold metal-dependent hydrolase